MDILNVFENLVENGKMIVKNLVENGKTFWDKDFTENEIYTKFL